MNPDQLCDATKSQVFTRTLDGIDVHLPDTVSDPRGQLLRIFGPPIFFVHQDIVGAEKQSYQDDTGVNRSDSFPSARTAFRKTVQYNTIHPYISLKIQSVLFMPTQISERLPINIY